MRVGFPNPEIPVMTNTPRDRSKARKCAALTAGRTSIRVPGEGRMSHGICPPFVGKTNAIAFKGFQDFSKLWLSSMTTAFEGAVAASKEFAAAKSPLDLIQLQSKLSQGSIATVLEETKKATELTASILKEISAPLTETFQAGIAAATKAGMKKAA